MLAAETRRWAGAIGATRLAAEAERFSPRGSRTPVGGPDSERSATACPGRTRMLVLADRPQRG